MEQTVASNQLPEGACCLSCGYLLHGLREPRCSECGRAFDPTDPTTFGTLLGVRRRKWIRRFLAAAIIVLAYLGAGPRGVMHHVLTLSCGKCGEKISVERMELRPPRWISLHYPGWTFAPEHFFPTDSSQEGPASRAASKYACPHAWDSISYRDGATGRSGSVTCQEGYEPTFCGFPVTTETISNTLDIVPSRQRAACSLKPGDDELVENDGGGGK